MLYTKEVTMHQVIHGDSLDVLRQMDDNSIDAIVTDPPAGIAFMNSHWDRDKGGRDQWIAWMAEVAAECLRVIKPGGHALVWAIPRTSHWTGMAWEQAGWEPRDKVYHAFGSGFPKSHNGPWGGTALKPAVEEWWLFRKPLCGTVAANVLQWGTGALNIDACRVGDDEIMTRGGGGQCGTSLGWSGRDGRKQPTVRVEQNTTHVGRWPANLVHDGSDDVTDGLGHAARYFYCAKASRRERDAGLSDDHAAMRNDGRQTDIDNPYQRGKVLRNHHATVKPIALMEWLIKLITPPGGVVLDPFAGSGTTGCAAARLGVRSILIEREAEYVEIARRRVAYWSADLDTIHQEDQRWQ